MTGASRQKKFKMYEVEVRREVEYICVVKVEARSVEEAGDTARAAADAAEGWGEGHVISVSSKVKVLR